MAQIFKSPAAYVQGRDVAEEIGSHAEELGEEAVLIADEIVLDILEDRVDESRRRRTGYDVGGVQRRGVRDGN